MKIKEGYILREVADSNIVVPIGNAQVSFNGIMTLNDVGAFIWRLLEKGADKEQLLSAVLEEYDVDSERAEWDLNLYLEKLRSKDLIED